MWSYTITILNLNLAELNYVQIESHHAIQAEGVGKDDGISLWFCLLSNKLNSFELFSLPGMSKWTQNPYHLIYRDGSIVVEKKLHSLCRTTCGHNFLNSSRYRIRMPWGYLWLQQCHIIQLQMNLLNVLGCSPLSGENVTLNQKLAHAQFIKSTHKTNWTPAMLFVGITLKQWEAMSRTYS